MEDMVNDDRLLFFGSLFISLSATQILLERLECFQLVQRPQLSVICILMQTVFLNDKYKIANAFVTVSISIR